MKLLKSKRGGFALAAMLCAVVLLIIVGVGVLSVGMHQRTMSVRTSSEITARCSADAGLTKALAEMNKQLALKTWNDTSLPSTAYEPLPNCDSTYSYKVSKITLADGNDLYTIHSSGKSGWSRKTVNCTLEMKGLFEYAIYVAEDLTLRSGTSVTAYNQGADDPVLQICTNSTDAGAVTCKSGVTIDGDIVVGPGGDPDVVINNTTEATVTGETYSSLIKNKPPNIHVPQSLLDMFSSGPIDSSTTLSSSAKYDNINLIGTSGSDPNKMDKVTVDGNIKIYVTGDLRLGNGDEVEIQPDASLTVFLGGNLYVDNSGAINNLTQDPKKFKIYALDTCTNIDFKNSGIFYGAIYAPEADIHLYNGFNVYGAVVGKSFTQDVDANFFYDMLLREVDISEIGVHLVIKRWSEE
ncbi:MAG: DUF7305 domain-containing protein [Planctomycetota bacterium]|jgi:hypothetical protein